MRLIRLFHARFVCSCSCSECCSKVLSLETRLGILNSEFVFRCEDIVQNDRIPRSGERRNGGLRKPGWRLGMDNKSRSRSKSKNPDCEYRCEKVRKNRMIPIYAWLPRNTKAKRLCFNMLKKGMITLPRVGVLRIPVGIQDISRWLSGATPPVTRRPRLRSHPGGMTDASP